MRTAVSLLLIAGMLLNGCATPWGAGKSRDILEAPLPDAESAKDLRVVLNDGSSFRLRAAYADGDTLYGSRWERQKTRVCLQQVTALEGRKTFSRWEPLNGDLPTRSNLSALKVTTDNKRQLVLEGAYVEQDTLHGLTSQWREIAISIPKLATVREDKRVTQAMMAAKLVIGAAVFVGFGLFAKAMAPSFD